MNTEVKKILGVSGGAFAGGAALKMMKKTDGTTNPIIAIGAAGGGIALAIKSKSPLLKSVGLGLAAVGIIATLGKVAEKVPVMGRFTPSIGGLGELYEDEDGNLVELGGLNGQPQLVQDSNGQTYMIEGLAGDDYYDDEMEDLVGLSGDEYYDDDYELEGLAGDELERMVA